MTDGSTSFRIVNDEMRMTIYKTRKVAEIACKIQKEACSQSAKESQEIQLSEHQYVPLLIAEISWLVPMCFRCSQRILPILHPPDSWQVQPACYDRRHIGDCKWCFAQTEFVLRPEPSSLLPR